MIGDGGVGCGGTATVGGTGRLWGNTAAGTVGLWVGPAELAELVTGEPAEETTRCDGGREIRATVAGPSCPVPKRAATGGTARCDAGGWLWCPTVG